MNRVEWEQKLTEAGLSRFSRRLADAALPSLAITPEVAGDHSVGSSVSKFGGLPDTPENFQWPYWDGRPLSFLAQINLASTFRPSCPSVLPTSGLLSFFYDAEQSTAGFDPNDKGSWAVCLFEQKGLQRTTLPNAIPDDARFTECSLTFSENITPVSWQSDFIRNIGFNDDEEELYFRLTLASEDGNHHLFGHPQEIQEEMQRECQLASNGIYCGDPDRDEDPREVELEAGQSDWLLLLQLDSDDNPGWMWGDCGRLYFWIRQDDLSMRRFENAWMVFQCS